MAFENWPYCNFHDLNLDWILRTIKKLENRIDNQDGNITYLQTELARLKAIIDSIQSGTAPAYQNTGTYANTNLAKQLVYATAQSYYMDAWHTRNSAISYGNIRDNSAGIGTALDDGAVIYGKLDCSTFVILSLLGLPYNESPYANPDNAVPLRGRLGFTRQFVQTNNNITGKIRWAYELLLWGAYNGLLYDFTTADLPNGDYSKIETGDIIFFCWNDDYAASQPAGWWGDYNYEHAAHVGVAVSGCQQFAHGVGMLHAVSTDAGVQFTDLERYRNAVSNMHMYTKILRPRLNIDRAYVQGMFRFRGTIDNISVQPGKSGYSYAGGKIPSNATRKLGVDTTTGATQADNKSLTTFYLPYNRSIVSSWSGNALTNVTITYHYYDKDTGYLGNSTSFDPNKADAALMRITFTTRTGTAMSDAMYNILMERFIISYHTWCDTYSNQPCELSATVRVPDTVVYFREPTELASQIKIYNV